MEIPGSGIINRYIATQGCCLELFIGVRRYFLQSVPCEWTCFLTLPIKKKKLSHFFISINYSISDPTFVQI